MGDLGVGKPVTRADVAHLAGTSTATVSYVINNGPKTVAPATRERVLAAVAELGYRPNLIARSLRASNTETIGMVVPYIENTFFAGLVSAVEEEAIRHGKMVLFGTTGWNGEIEDHFLTAFDDRRVDAILVIGPSLELRGETRHGQGALLIMDRTRRGGTVSIGINHRAAAAAATAHLADHGYERIGCIAGPPPRQVSATRVRGWRAALQERGLPHDRTLLRRGPHTIEGGYVATRSLFTSANPPRAVFVSSDTQAVGALRALYDLGIRVPDDVALFAFDGTRISDYLVPGVSSVCQPITTFARMAMEVIQETDRSDRYVEIPFELALRASCGCPPVLPHCP